MTQFPHTMTHRMRRAGTYLIHVGLFCLVVLGIMNVVHNLSFREPVDGAIWADVDGKLTVQGLVWSYEETELQVGDVLISINDQEIRTNEERLDYLYSLGIDPRRPVMYRVAHSDTFLQYWVYIRGQREVNNRDFYFSVFTGFVYLVFLLLLLFQDLAIAARRSLAFFSFSVFLTFVYRPTRGFALLDWVALALDTTGALLLPSAMATVAITFAMGRSRLRLAVQAVHWIPTLGLCGWGISIFLNDLRGLPDYRLLLSQWSGALIALSALVLVLVAELRAHKIRFALAWALSWIAYALSQFGVPLPLDPSLLAALPVLLPLTFLYDWSRSGRMYLGTIGKRVIVYFTVVLLLAASYALFIFLFQTLLETKISRQAHGTVLGLAIMFAAVTYAPLNHFFAELLDRLIYGKRYQSIREFGDLGQINRADTDIDDFLWLLLCRIKSAFQIAHVTAYKTGEHERVLHTIVPIAEQKTIRLEVIPKVVLDGHLVRGHEVVALLEDPDSDTKETNPFQPNDYLMPIRVSGKLSALIVLAPQGNDLRFSPEEERLLLSVMRQSDILMENMELYHAVNQKANSFNQLKEYNENIIESSRIGILTTDDMQRAVSCNNAFLELAGIPRPRIMGQTFDQVFQVTRRGAQRLTRAGYLLEGTYRSQSGEELELEIQKTPLRTRENEVYGTLYLVEDIREKKKFNEQIMQQEKLASIGMLAAGVAHEINTPLTGIASYSQILMSDPALNEDQRELLDLIRAQSHRAAKIVNELLNFSRKGKGPKGPVDLLQVLNQTLRFLGHQIQKQQTQVKVVPPEEPAIIEGYDNQIQQVFLNLIVNAMDAMPLNGTLTLSFERRQGLVRLSIRDTGVGMDPQVQSHIFDPFYTTKEVGKGTGLGLAVVYNILQEHRARVEVSSCPNQGTEFILIFNPYRPPDPAAIPEL